MIPNARIREAVEAKLSKGLTVSDIAFILGWTNKGRPDGSRVKRVLGMMAVSNGGIKEEIPEELGVAILRAIGLDPWEVGI